MLNLEHFLDLAFKCLLTLLNCLNRPNFSIFQHLVRQFLLRSQLFCQFLIEIADLLSELPDLCSLIRQSQLIIIYQALKFRRFKLNLLVYLLVCLIQLIRLHSIVDHFLVLDPLYLELLAKLLLLG